MQGSTYAEASIEADDLSAIDDTSDRIHAKSELDKRLHLDPRGATKPLAN